MIILCGTTRSPAPQRLIKPLLRQLPTDALIDQKVRRRLGRFGLDCGLIACPKCAHANTRSDLLGECRRVQRCASRERHCLSPVWRVRPQTADVALAVGTRYRHQRGKTDYELERRLFERAKQKPRQLPVWASFFQREAFTSC
jgi:hypothetical protein